MTKPIDQLITEAGDSLENADYEQSLMLCNEVLGLDGNHTHALSIAGLAYLRTRDLESATRYFDAAINSEPNNVVHWLNLAGVFKELGHFDKAINITRKALELYPESLDILFLQSGFFRAAGRFPGSVKMLNRIIEIDPGNERAHTDKSTTLLLALIFDGTVTACKNALASGVATIRIYNNLGAAHMSMSRYDDALKAFEHAMALDPDNKTAVSNAASVVAHTCDWGKKDRYEQRALELTFDAIEGNRNFTLMPFTSLTIDTTPEIQQAVTEHFVVNMRQRASAQIFTAGQFQEREKKDKIVVGYLSADFRNHPVFHLAKNLFRHHDRNRFKIICYSNGLDDGSDYRKHIIKTCDQFEDIRRTTTAQAIQKIILDQVDILIDMSGHTNMGRMDIVSARPAPIQIHFLGYPGTIGGGFVDYFITDHYLSPSGAESSFSEKLIYMPDTYQISDDEQFPSEVPVSRANENLPPDKFVFCSLNSSYKIEPKIFDAWMEILKRVPKSVLWLLPTSRVAENNLKNAAREHGVAAERLVFASRVDKPKHLSRHSLADLFLDTHIVCGHTTANDALQMGLPILTCPRENFISRVSSTLLHAHNLSELVCDSMEAYVNLAVELANDRNRLDKITTKLKVNCRSVPFRDTRRFVKHLELAYEKAVEIYDSGRAPEHIDVTSLAVP